jgi:hypothetical protein
MTPAHLILLFLANSLLIFGIYELMHVEYQDENNPSQGVLREQCGLFYKIHLAIVNRIGVFATKPICICIPCMASIHSIYFYWTTMYLTNNINQQSAIIYVAYSLSLIGFNHIVAKLINK